MSTAKDGAPSSGDAASQRTDLPGTPLPFIMHFVRLYRGWYGAILLLQIIGVACSVWVPWSLGAITRLVSEGLKSDSAQQLLVPLSWFAALIVCEVLFNRGASGCHIRVLPKQRRRVTQALYAYLQQHSQRFISNQFAGALAHKVTEVSIGVSQALAILLFDLLSVLLVLIFSVILLLSVSLPLGLFTLLWSLSFILLCYFLARRSQPLAQQYSAARSTSNGKVVDAVSNLASIRLFARQPFEQAYLTRYLDTEFAAANRSFKYMERVRWFQSLCGILFKLGMLLMALYLWQTQVIDIAAFVMATSLSLLIIGDVGNLSRRLLEFFEAVGSISNGLSTLIHPHEVVDQPQASTLKVRHGQIEFRQVGFSYTPGKPIFRDLNIIIPPGQKVGLVGASGSGKTSLLNLLLRLYDVEQGQVLLDGVDIRTVTQASLHQQIGLIPQEPGLFHRSIRENIHYGRLDASQDELSMAIYRAGASSFIEQMPQGYESLVGERGVKLSGGQRQRIAIARVLLKNAPILVMDEATSSLDSLTERYIQEKLDEIMGDKTVLVVAHRLSTVAHLDRILVFDNGKVIEDGSHAELLAKRGQYYRLWSRQETAEMLS
ncbi:ABC transporter ATP-binding protein [Pseudomonas sp. 5P_3.1_Bac2]|uniref:ABC transporter ATP-binding protein n=1 Tax=Pseudomonas sp. 5P_3.1_Bac2 TaxID=2971617 RepID=UPI0021C8F2ED|nr:ABC transporter ATP-binding protein [Pseudomonas sp. 5P_3.1_Bac2]MCU1715898.1 ABC transporter ATP-binding protein/permease [Pseudomonas sp. 5P_3.1_Bac2]